MATLISLPKEISDKIWHTVLSPTGYAILLPNPDAHARWDHLNYYDLFAITISDISPTTFTREKISPIPIITSKAIHETYRHSIWEINTIYLDASHIANELGAEVKRDRRGRPFPHPTFGKKVEDSIRSVCLHLDFTQFREFAATMKTLGRWKREGNLRRVEIRFMPGLDNLIGVLRFKKRGRFRGVNVPAETYGPFLEALAGLAKEGVTFKVVVQTGFDLGDADSRREMMKTGFGGEGGLAWADLEEMLKEIHATVGGELWHDHRLCFKNRNEVSRPFRIEDTAQT